MIIVLKKNAFNKAIAKQLASSLGEEICFYPDVVFSANKKDDRLILLDLTADGGIQELFGLSTFLENVPEPVRDSRLLYDLSDKSVFADFLATRGLPDSIKIIDFYISEVKSADSRDSLYDIASHLTECLSKSHKREVTVRIASDENYDYTVIAPPKNEHGQWTIYGLSKSDLTTGSNLEAFLTLPNKSLLWSGETLESWLSISERNIISSHAQRMEFRVSKRKKEEEKPMPTVGSVISRTSPILCKISKEEDGLEKKRSSSPRRKELELSLSLDDLIRMLDERLDEAGFAGSLTQLPELRIQKLEGQIGKAKEILANKQAFSVSTSAI